MSHMNHMNHMDQGRGWADGMHAGGARLAVTVAAVLTALFAFMPAVPRVTLFSRAPDYLAFHSTVETFSTVIAGLVFAVGWNSYRHSRPGNLSILAAGFLGICLLNIGHTLGYAGMPDFITPSGPEKAIGFWLAERLLAVTCFLAVGVRPGAPGWPCPLRRC